MEETLREFKAQQRPDFDPETDALPSLYKDEHRELAMEMLSQNIGKHRNEFRDHLERGTTGNLQFLKQVRQGLMLLAQALADW